MHQTVSGIVNKYQKAAFWRTAFKPVMVGAIDLDKFAQAIQLMAGWLTRDLRRACGTQSPSDVI